MEGVVAENNEQAHYIRESEDELDDEENEESNRMVGVTLQKLSHFIMVYFGLSEAWRQIPFK